MRADVKPSDIIDGKHVREYVNVPYGAFEKIVREKHDPYWGFKGKPIKFKVEYRAEIRTYKYGECVVVAPDKKTAMKMAYDKADEEFEGFEDIEEIEITSIKPCGAADE